MAPGMLESVINVSEGRRFDRLEVIARTAGAELLDVHTDADHHRSVLTVVGEDAARAIAAATVMALDLGRHSGVHPRIGVLDVVPFVPLGDATMADALAARDRFARWAGAVLGVPCFLYGALADGTERTLPEIRRRAFVDLEPDTGPARPHPTAGAVAVGARPILVAYNLWLAEPDIDLAKSLARDLRGPAVRALGLEVGDEVQVSMNLIEPLIVGPASVFDTVAAVTPIERAELVGLAPRVVLDDVDESRWASLDLALDATIESRLERQGLVDREWRALRRD